MANNDDCNDDSHTMMTTMVETMMDYDYDGWCQDGYDDTHMHTGAILDVLETRLQSSLRASKVLATKSGHGSKSLC